MARQGRRPDRTKERFWRRLLQQWRHSGRTVRAFCAEHAISAPAFYFWRRTIAQRDRQAGHGTGLVSGDATPPTFVPVRVIPAPVAMSLEVVLGRGRVVRVPAGFDPATLRQLLAILDEEPSC